jgi:hypothetical protein
MAEIHSPPPPFQSPGDNESRRIADEALLRRLTAEARARAGLPDPEAPAAVPRSPIAGVLARLGAGRAEHPKIHAADVPARRLAAADTDDFLRRVRAASEARQTGDCLRGTLRQVAQALAYFARIQGRGCARVTFESIAKAAGVCVETARRAVRWLESAGLIDTVNVLVRRPIGGVRRLVRDANLYLFPPAAEAPGAAGTPPRDSAARARATIARWGDQLGLGLRLAGAWRDPRRTLRET